MEDDDRTLNHLEELLASDHGKRLGRASLAAELRRLADICDATDDGHEREATEPSSSYIVGMEEATAPPAKKPRRRRGRTFDMDKYRKRFVAFKIAYVGWRYQGFAYQGHTNNTVEANLFAALQRTRLVPENVDPKTISYTRSGRTDKGVSAACQVVSLYVRSKGETDKPELSVDDELDYPNILNGCLPLDIRVLGWAPVDNAFHARYSAKYREYKYFLASSHVSPLNIEAMQQAASFFCGRHDFRNFCRMFLNNVRNHVRDVLECRLEPVPQCRWDGCDLYVLNVRGSGFLWHQVRCMVAVLMMVGKGLECPNVVQKMLNVQEVAAKPLYTIASEIPLVLTNVGYEVDLEFRQSAHADAKVRSSLQDIFERNLYGAVLVHHLMSESSNSDAIQGGAQPIQESRHAPLLYRQREPSMSERLEREERKVIREQDGELTAVS